MYKYSQQIHHGKNIKRLRELLGYKQEVLAIALDITQQSVSEMEQKQTINKKTLHKIAEILNVPTEAIENMNEKTFNENTNDFIKNIFNTKISICEGRVIQFLREYLKFSIEEFSVKLGLSEKEIEEIENMDIVPDSILEKVAKTLNVPVEAIKNMSDDTTINYINTFNDKVESSFLLNNNPINCTFNPIDKIVELYNEKEALYERMLKEKDTLLEKFLSK